MFDPNNHNFDLHMHSTASDGTNSPEEIIRLIKDAGMWIFSITDHDGIAGSVRAKEILDQEAGSSDPIFLTGVEFSCKDEHGKYHILGYGYDSSRAPVNDAVKHAHDLRMSKVTGRLDFLKEKFGFTFSEEDLNELLSLPNPGKPHIGHLMARYGYAPNKDIAISEYVNQYNAPNVYLDPEEAIQAILASGGIPVLAHPFFGNGSQKILGKDMEDRLDRLVGMGIQGVEAFYSGFSGDLICHMLTLADRHDLYVTAGSDYHGTNKPVQLGQTCFTEDWDMPAGMKNFLERVSGH